MEIVSREPDRLEFRHDGMAGARPMLLVVVGCVAVVALATASGGAWGTLVVVLAIGTFIAGMLWRSSADTVAVFDRAADAVTIVHKRRGRPFAHTEMPLTGISGVIVEAAGRSARTDRMLSLRPALVADAKIVPLTWRAFVNGDPPVKAATAIRRFLGHSEEGLFADSVAALARHTGRVNPAVRIARIGMGMGRREAADHVALLREKD